MLLNISNVRGEHTSLDDLRSVHDALSTAGARFSTIRVQHCGLLSMSIAPSAALQHITTLTLMHNRISTLQGLDAFPCLEVLDLSHNALRVMDAHSASLLCRLRRLRRCDLSHNEMRFIDFDISSRVSPSVGEDAPGVTLDELVFLNLAHNQLLEVPDLRGMPLLEELVLEHNRMESLVDLDARLPLLALRSLAIGHNAIPTLPSLLPLTALAETLRAVTVAGNPCVLEASIASAARPWLLWLSPFLESIDGTAVGQDEHEIASRLFRHGEALSYEALQMMDGAQSAQLEAYLRKWAHIGTKTSTAMGTSTGTASMKSVAGGTGGATTPEAMVTPTNNASFTMPSLGGTLPRLPTAVSVEGSVTSCGVRRATVEVVLQAMQKKLRQLSSVVETLWKESMTRRVFATVVLQRYTRGFLVRKRLSPTWRRTFARIRSHLQRHPRTNPTAAAAMTTSTSSNAPNTTSAVASSGSLNGISHGAELVAQLRQIDSGVRRLYGEMSEYRRMLDRQQRAAAVTIQRHYRGHLDRRRWSGLKERYDEFVASLRPDVVVLQRFGRGLRVRRQIGARYARDGELRKLRAEVCELRHNVWEMRGLLDATLRRQRLDRYADPEKAMGDIIARHAVPRESAETAEKLATRKGEGQEEVDVEPPPVPSILEKL